MLLGLLHMPVQGEAGVGGAWALARYAKDAFDGGTGVAPGSSCASKTSWLDTYVIDRRVCDECSHESANSRGACWKPGDMYFCKDEFLKSRNWFGLAALALGTIGGALAVKSFLPQRLVDEDDVICPEEALDTTGLPAIEVAFLRCGSVVLPECIAVRGAFSLKRRVIAHSAILIRHPQGTFLYDTGLCTHIHTFLRDQSLYFRKTLARFVFEQSISQHLQRVALPVEALDFVLLSHLHWDHVSGLPDLPGVPLRINQVEYLAAQEGLLAQRHGLVRRLMGENPFTLFSCNGPAYAGFTSSHDLFGDGSIILVPLPGHTAGQTGMFINRSNGSRLFMIGDAAWVAENYLCPAPMHPFIWSNPDVTADDAVARQTLIALHHYARSHPEVPLIPMHDARMQAAFMAIEQH